MQKVSGFNCIKKQSKDSLNKSSLMLKRIKQNIAHLRDIRNSIQNKMVDNQSREQIDNPLIIEMQTSL